MCGMQFSGIFFSSRQDLKKWKSTIRHPAVRSGEHIGISPLTSKRVQPRKDSAVRHHLLNCNYSPTSEDFIVLCHENKKYLLELKKSLL